jgi:hypothetical protein
MHPSTTASECHAYSIPIASGCTVPVVSDDDEDNLPAFGEGA